MPITQTIILALIQGITEFLPISSSAHLILPKELLGWPDQGLAFDVAVHAGSLIAVMVYFRKDVQAMVGGFLGSFGNLAGLSANPAANPAANQAANLAWCLVIATVPAGLMGLLLDDLIQSHLRSITVIAVTTVVFGLALWWADSLPEKGRTLAQMSFGLALIIGCAQALALVPGTSRSGITITAALFLGFHRSEAARFSFLMSIPIIGLSAVFKGSQLVSQEIDWFVLVVGILVSALSAWFCIYFFLGFINRIGMLPFVLYRLVLGAVLIAIVLTG